MTNPTTPDQGDERRAFEQHIEATEKRKPMLWSTAYANGNEVCPAPLEGVYFQVADQKAWLAWQAARALSVAQPVVDQEPASMSDNGSCGSQVSGKPVSAEAGKVDQS